MDAVIPTPRVYVSHDAHGWRVILDGSPVTRDMPDRDRAVTAYRLLRGLKGPLNPYVWDGEAGAWEAEAK